jgi:long-chain acyl-CoA synthetase
MDSLTSPTPQRRDGQGAIRRVVVLTDSAFAGAGEHEPTDGVSLESAASQTSLAKAFALVARQRAAHAAVITQHQRFSYSQVWAAASRLAHCLQRCDGFAEGKCVAVRLPNSPQYVAAFYGVLLAGGVPVPLSTGLPQNRFIQAISECGAAIVIAEESPAPPAAEVRVTGESGLAKHCPGLHCHDDSAVATILFTSGSTGALKGVMLSHRNLLANARSICRCLPIRDDDRTLALAPFCHALGNSVLQTHLLSGATLVIAGSSMFPGDIAEAIDRQRATSLLAVPDVLRPMMHGCEDSGPHPLARLRYVGVAGSRLDPDSARRLASLISPAGLFVMYGQTEATARLSCLAPQHLRNHPASVGKPIAGVQFQVVDDRGHALPAGETGQLQARGDNVMLGYLNDAAGTAQAVRNGWLNTGDLASIDDEGFVYLHGRANTLIKIQGHRVHPREVEDVVREKFSALDVCVVPYDHDGSTRLALFISGRFSSAGIVNDIRFACRQQLSAYKVPSLIEVLPSLPRTGSLKVDRATLAARASKNAARPIAALQLPSTQPFQGTP